MSGSDWYAVLGVGRAASQAQVARAFRKLAFRWHPDRNAGRPELAHQQFLLVHRAYEILSDPAKRRALDAELAPPRAAVPAAPPPRKPPPAARARGDAPLAPPPPSKPRFASTALSRVSWFVLSLLIQSVGFLAMLVIGPIGERRANDALRSRVPAFAEFVFPMGRMALVAGLIGLGVWAYDSDVMGLRFPLILLGIGGVVFVIERIALASFWALGRGRSRRP